MAPMPSLNPFGVNRRVGTCCPSGKVMSIFAKLPRASAIGAVQNAETFSGEGNPLRQKFALPILPPRNDSLTSNRFHENIDFQSFMDNSRHKH
jgi:hypothetical protein